MREKERSNTSSKRSAGVADRHGNGADVIGDVKTCPPDLGPALVQPHAPTAGQYQRRHVTDVVVFDQSDAALVVT